MIPSAGFLVTRLGDWSAVAEIHMLVSPQGGRGRAAAAAPVVRQVIKQCGHTAVDLSGATAAESEAAAIAAVAAGAQRLIAVGGDGCLHSALQATAGSDTVLGLVPAGTGNDYARAFELHTLSVEQATERALGPAQPVDAISTSSGRWAAFSVTGGFSVDVNRRAERMRFPKGPSRYTVAALLALWGLRHRELSVTVDGQRSQFRSTLFAIANTATFGGGMAVCPDASAHDGLLDVCVVGPVGRATLLRLLPKVFDGSHVGHRHVHLLRGCSITIESLDSAPLDLVADGEPLASAPLTATVVPGAVRLAH